MNRLDRVRLTRRDMLKLSAGGAGAFVLTSSGLAVSSGLARGGGGGSIYIEAFPTSPLILSPFNDPLPVPKALQPVPKADVDAWRSPPGADNQDFVKKYTTFVKGARYDKMIEAFGGAGVNATTPDELKRAVDAAMDSGRPTVINAVIDPSAGTESGSIGKLNPQSAVRKT